MLKVERKEIIRWGERIVILLLVLGFFWQWFPLDIKKSDSIKDVLKPPEAEARYQWDPSGGSIVTGSDYPVQDAISNTPSYRALLANDSWHWVTNFDLASGLDKRAYIDGVRLQGANKMTITYGGYVSDAAGTNLVQIYDNDSSTWRTLNWRDTAFSVTTDTDYAFEIYNGYWQSGGEPVDTPLSNFVTNDSNKRVQIRVYSTVTGRALVHYWDRLNIEVAIGPLVYARSLTRLNGWTGTITNNYTWTNYADNGRLIATNQSGTSMDFYLSFQNVQTYPGANTIFVHHQGLVSNAALTHQLQIYNFTTPGWENLNATLLSNTAETDYYFAQNNIDLTNYVSSNEVRIRYYTTTFNTYTLSIDLVYITIGSTNNDVAQCQVSFGTEAGGTSCADTRTIDTSSADSTWQQATDKIAAAGFYPGDYAGTWDTNYSASANLWVPITIPTNTAVTGIEYVARFRSNSTANTMMPCLKDMSGLNPTVLGTGYAATGGWVDVSVSNALTTYTNLNPYTYTHYTSPEDFIDTLNNRANIRMRTSASTATASVTRDWDFAMLSIKWLQDDTLAANNPQYVGTSGSLEVGTAVAVVATNPASTTATYYSDNYYWQNKNLTSGADRLDVRVNIDGVNLNNSNKMIITYEGLVSNATLTYLVQIYDNASSTWRTLNDRGANLVNTADTSYYFSIFNGFWNNVNDPIDTPLSNFITTDGNKRVQIRIYSSAAIGTAYTHSLDRIQIEVATDPVYWAKDFERTQGTGTITNTYKFTHPAAANAITTGGSDNLRLTVANSNPAFDFYLDFGNIQTYTGANAIMIYYEGSTSVAANTYRLKIYKFNNGAGWEDLTTTSMNNTTETAYQFAKAPITITDYIDSVNNVIRIGFDGLTTTAGNMLIDYVYVTVGTVISAEGNAEVTIGQTAGGSSPLNSQSLDTTLTSPSAWEIQTSSATDNPYAQDYAGLINVNQQATANINFGPALSNTAGVTGIRYAMRMLSASTYLTWQGYLEDYSGLTGIVGGWLLVGTTNVSAATYTFTEGWQEATFRNAEDFLDTFNNKVNLKMKPSATTQGIQITPNWDFAFVSIRWYENSANSYYNYQLTPTGGSLPTGTDLSVQQVIQNVGSYKALFTTDNQWWVIKNDVSNGMDARVNLDYVILSSQTNKLFITFEAQISAAAGTFYLQIYDNVLGDWRTVTDREAVIGSTTETTYSYEIYNGRWQSGGVPIDTPLSNFVTSDSLKRMQFRIYSTVTGQAFAVYVDRLLLEIGTDSLYWAANKNISVGTASNNYAYTYTSDNNKLSVANTAGQSFDYDLSFKNILTYDGANAIFVAYEGLTSVATMTYRLKIWNFVTNGGQWEDLTSTAMANTADATYYFAKGPVTLSNYISGGEVRIGFYTPTIIAGTHSIDYLYIMVGSVIDEVANSEISFGTEEGGSSVLNTQSIDTTLTLGSEDNWGITTALTAANPYMGDYAGTYGTNDNGAANISFPVTQPSNTKITGIRYVARYLSNSANNTIEYAIRDYSGWLGTTGGYVDPGSVGNNSATTYTIGTYRYTNNPEDFVNTATNKINMKIRTTASTDSTTVTDRWDFAFVSISWRVDENHSSWSNQLYPTGGSLEVGTSPAVSSTNYGTYRATWASDDGRWQNQNLTSGADRLDVRVNIDGVNLNNANKMIITYEGYVSNVALTYYVQIYDNASSTWRNLNDREVALSSITEASYYFSIFNGFWNTGNDPVDTPLSNFITTDSDKRVQIRIYSNAAIGTAYAHSLDRVLLEVVTSPVYWAKDFERTQGTGTITNTYKFTHPAATLAATTGGDDDVELSVANVLGESFDYYFTFGNIQTYTGANAILVYQESRSSVAALTYRLKIYNFTTPGWEDLTTTNINATAADTVYQFAKAPVNLSDYISENELRIGYYTSATVSGTHYVDYIYVTIGTVIFDTSDAEISFGSSDGSSVLNTQDLDTTLANPNVYGINTATTATNHYANDYPAGLYNMAQAGAVNITFRAAAPNGAFITGYRFAARYRSNSTYTTVRSGTFDYAGLTGTTGGWYETGTTNALTTYTYTEGWHHATDNNVEDFTANYQKKFNMRLRTTASTLGSQTTIGLDFFFIAVRFAGAVNISQNYYRWYVNENDITPTDPWPVGGTNLGENTAITASDSPPGTGTVLRARISIRVQAQDLAANSQDFKLQYATSTNCVSVPWDQWSDVVATSSCSASDIWCGYENATPLDGATLPSTLLSVSDVAETYEESNPSALNPNSATIGQDIEYDWVIKNNNATAETSYCFRMAKSDGDPLSAYNNYLKLITGVTYPAPVVSNVQLNNQANIDLIENTTTSTSATADVSDAQGCSTITGVTAKIYRSGVTNGKDCIANENNCYSVASCTQNSCVGNNATYTCTIDMQFHADPTDEIAEYWRAYIEATDDTSLTGSGYSPADVPDVNTLVALNISTTTINYETVNPNEVSSQQTIEVQTTGNTAIDVKLSGIDMTWSGNTILVGQQKYSASTGFDWETQGTALTGATTCHELSTGKPTEHPSVEAENVYWKLKVPTGKPAGGPYAGNSTLEAANESSCP